MIRKLISMTAAVALAVPALAQAAPAAKFLAEAMQANNAEIRLGQLAQSHASSPKVREYGTTLTKDHTKARDLTQAAAHKEGVRLPDGLKPDAEATYKMLQGLSGTAFDKAFVQHMIADHRKDIAKFEAQTKTGDATTAQLAKATLPDLKKHLAIALSLK